MKRAILLAFAILAGCKSTPAPVSDDAGWIYRPAAASDAGFEAIEHAGQTLVLIAGKPGARGDLDGVGANARIGLVGGMARVGDVIVFADEGNGSIRRFDPKTQAVETIVRLPKGDRPPMPAFVAYDGSTLYVSDRSSHVIYALDLGTRALSVLAGKASVRGDTDGALGQALFDAPTGLVLVGRELFVADTGSRRIRKIDLDKKTVSTFGDPFFQVWGLCSDGESIFATDNLREAVFRVDAKTGASKHVAGSNRFGYGGPTDGPPGIGRLREPRGVFCGGDHLLVADRGNGAVRKIEKASFAISTLAGFRQEVGARDGDPKHALFADVQSVLEWDDAIYIGDEAALRVLSLTEATVRTVAGSAAHVPNIPTMGSTFDVPHQEVDVLVRPTGVFASAAERAAFVTTCGNAVFRVDLGNGEATPLAGDPRYRDFVDGSGIDARFACTGAITGDDRGNLFVGDRGNHAVRSVRIATREVETLAGVPTKCGNDDGPFASATFCDPIASVFVDDAVFVVDASTHAVRRIDLRTRTVSTIAGMPFSAGFLDGPGKSARFNTPSGIAYRDGVLLIADRENNALRRVELRSGIVNTLAKDPLQRPTAVAAIADGWLVADAHALRRVAGSELASLVDVGLGLRLGATPSLSQPSGIFPLARGSALVVDRAEGVVVRLDY